MAANAVARRVGEQSSRIKSDAAGDAVLGGRKVLRRAGEAGEKCPNLFGVLPLLSLFLGGKLILDRRNSDSHVMACVYIKQKKDAFAFTLPSHR